MHKFLKKYGCVHESWSPFGGPGANVLQDETLKKLLENTVKHRLKFHLNIF